MTVYRQRRVDSRNANRSATTLSVRQRTLLDVKYTAAKGQIVRYGKWRGLARSRRESPMKSGLRGPVGASRAALAQVAASRLAKTAGFYRALLQSTW